MGGLRASALTRARRAAPFARVRGAQAREFYTKDVVEYFVAFLIVANFITNIMERWKDPVYSARGLIDCKEDEIEAGWCAKMRFQESVWWGFGLFYNIAFTIELVINYYAYAPLAFWKSGWNRFDFVVVLVGVLSYMPFQLPGPLSLLRLMRAFRVFRLFKRVKSLNKIIVSLGKAIPGVANAFLIMVIFMCIFAILGVEFFSQFGPDGTMTTYQDHGQRGIDWTNLTGLPIENGDCDEINGTVAGGGCVVVPLVTARGYTYGEEYYGTFFRALYTLFQVMTGESWSEAVARPTLFGYVNPQIGAVLTGLFYVSFIIITQIIMINVRRRAQLRRAPFSAPL